MDALTIEKFERDRDILWRALGKSISEKAWDIYGALKKLENLMRYGYARAQRLSSDVPIEQHHSDWRYKNAS